MPQQIQLRRLAGRPEVVSAQSTPPPPEIEVTDRFRSMLPEDARRIDQWNESMRTWWSGFMIQQTKE